MPEITICDLQGNTTTREMTAEEVELYSSDVSAIPSKVRAANFKAVVAHVGLAPVVEVYLASRDLAGDALTRAFYEQSVWFDRGAPVLVAARFAIGVSEEGCRQMYLAASSVDQDTQTPEQMAAIIDSIVTLTLPDVGQK